MKKISKCMHGYRLGKLSDGDAWPQKAGKVPISGLPTNEIEEQCKISLENLEIAKIKWSDFTEQEQWVLFTGWKSKKILS